MEKTKGTPACLIDRVIRSILPGEARHGYGSCGGQPVTAIYYKSDYISYYNLPLIRRAVGSGGGERVKRRALGRTVPFSYLGAVNVREINHNSWAHYRLTCVLLRCYKKFKDDRGVDVIMSTCILKTGRLRQPPQPKGAWPGRYGPLESVAPLGTSVDCEITVRYKSDVWFEHHHSSFCWRTLVWSQAAPSTLKLCRFNIYLIIFKG